MKKITCEPNRIRRGRVCEALERATILWTATGHRLEATGLACRETVKPMAPFSRNFAHSLHLAEIKLISTQLHLLEKKKNIK